MSEARLKIVQAIFTNGFAGSERIAVELCNALSAKHDVMLLVADDCDRFPGHSILAHVSPAVQVRKISRRLRTLQVMLATLLFRASVYHGHLGRAVSYAKFLPRSIVRVATWHMGRPVKSGGLDGVILISDWQKALLPKRKIETRIVNNWVSDFKHPTAERIVELRAEFGLGPDDFVVGFIGRPSPLKGIVEAIEAFQLWERPDVRFLIVGGTNDGLVFQMDGRDLRRENRDARILFTGYRSDAQDLYSIFDCLIAPSRAEPFGLTVIEAMHAGRRVIVRDTCGLGDIAAKNPDVLRLPSGEPEQLKTALEHAYLMRNVPPRYDMTPYDTSARVADIEAFYRELRAT